MPAGSAIHRPYALALGLYRRLPRFLRLFIIRRVAPLHTVGSLCMIEHDGRLLLLRQRHRRGWTLPGGLINRGESAARAVEREVAAETGLVVRVGLPFATVVDPSSRRVDVLFWVVANSSPAVRAAGEAIGADWLAPADSGVIDEPTSQAFAEFARFRAGGDSAHTGRLVGTA